MTYTLTREDLELAALACGKTVYGIYSTDGDGEFLPQEIGLDVGETDCILWQPHLPTAQGKADLLGMIEAIPLGVQWIDRKISGSVIVSYGAIEAETGHCKTKESKHAALAEAALKVAAQVGAKMKGGV